MTEQIKIQFAAGEAEFAVNEETYKLLTTYREFISDMDKTSAFVVPDIFVSTNMIKLIDILENYKEPFDLEEYNKERMKMNRDHNGLEVEKFISLNYLDMIFFEFMGVNIFDVSVVDENNEIFINFVEPIYKQEKSLNELKEIGKFKDDKLIIYEFTRTSRDCENKEIREIKKPEVRGFCLMKNYEVLRRIKKPFWYPDPVVPEGLWIKTRQYIYTSRINVVWENVDWNIIATYMNNRAIKPFILNYIQGLERKGFKYVKENQKESLHMVLDKIGYNEIIVKKEKKVIDMDSLEDHFYQIMLNE